MGRPGRLQNIKHKHISHINNQFCRVTKRRPNSWFALRLSLRATSGAPMAGGLESFKHHGTHERKVEPSCKISRPNASRSALTKLELDSNNLCMTVRSSTSRGTAATHRLLSQRPVSAACGPMPGSTKCPQLTADSSTRLPAKYQQNGNSASLSRGL